MYNCSDNFFRFGDDVAPKVFKMLKIKEIHNSRIDWNFIIKIEDEITFLKIKQYFNTSLIGDVELYITPKINMYEYLKIVNFNGNKWRDVIKIERKEKLKKINHENYK